MDGWVVRVHKGWIDWFIGMKERCMKERLTDRQTGQGVPAGCVSPR